MRMNKPLIVKSVLYGIITLFFIVLQTNLLNYVKIFGAKPNLFIPLIIAAAVFEKEYFAAVFGMTIGFLLDSSFSSPFFFSGILLFFCGFAGGILCRLYLTKSLFAMIILTLGGCFLRMAASYFYLMGIWKDFDFMMAFKYLFPEFVYTSAVAPFIYFLVKFTVAKIDHRKFLL